MGVRHKLVVLIRARAAVHNFLIYSRTKVLPLLTTFIIFMMVGVVGSRGAFIVVISFINRKLVEIVAVQHTVFVII